MCKDIEGLCVGFIFDVFIVCVCVCVCVCDEEGGFDLSITDSSSKVRNRIDPLVSFFLSVEIIVTLTRLYWSSCRL